MPQLRPVRLQPARERVASALRAAILAGQLGAGEVLTLEGTARELGVSATPVREAFQILERDGFIELARGRTAVVRGLTQDGIRDHYEVRASLEGLACALCCERRSDLARVGEQLEVAQEALARGDSSGYAEQNREFHEAIWEASGNERLARMLAELWNGLSMGANVTKAEYAKVSMVEHERIYEALLAREPQAARAAMGEHIMRSMRDIMTIYA